MRYSQEFKDNVVARLLSKELSISEAVKRYSIGKSTISYWLKIAREQAVCGTLPNKGNLKPMTKEERMRLESTRDEDIDYSVCCSEQSGRVEGCSPGQILPYGKSRQFKGTKAGKPCLNSPLKRITPGLPFGLIDFREDKGLVLCDKVVYTGLPGLNFFEHFLKPRGHHRTADLGTYL